jgi:O-antigen ligase
MTSRSAARRRRLIWQSAFACLAFIQIVATFLIFQERLYLTKWIAGLALILCFFILGRYKLSSALAIEFALIISLIGLGFVSQLGDNLDVRAMQLGASYTMTALTAFVVAPATFSRRSVHTFVWPGLLIGVSIGTLLAIYLGLRNPIASFTAHEGRVRFFGLFATPNSAGTAGLIGVILAGAAFRHTKRWHYLLFIPAFAAVIALAHSRGSLLAVTAFISTWAAAALLARLSTQSARLLSLASIIAIVAATMFYTTSYDRSRLFPTDLNQLSSGRWNNWSRSLSYLDSPPRWLFGLGLSRNFSFMPDVAVGKVTVRGSNADNIYVDLLGRTGIVGLALFLGTVGIVVVRLTRGLKIAPPIRAQDCALCIAAVIATLVLGLTESGVLTWGWLHAMVVWPLSSSTAAKIKAAVTPSTN